jgi:hypothetical protein
MKSKIIIFKVLAAIIAVGGAFASVSANSALVVTSAYVQYTTADTTNTYCTRVGDVCDHATGNPNICQITVRIGSVNSSYQGKAIGCSSLLLDTDAAADGTKNLPADAKVIQ